MLRGGLYFSREVAEKIPWFKGKDVAVSLEYANPKNAVLHHVDDKDKKTFHELLLGVTETVTPLNQQPHAAYINESGLYSLVLRSKKPQAKSFKRWVMNDVWWGFAGRQLRREGGNETFPPSPSPSPPASLEEGCT